MTTARKPSLSALLLGDYPNDREVVRDVFVQAGWQLFEAGERRCALDHLENDLVHVVIARADLPGWNWKRLLFEIDRLVLPPQLIVTSPQADERLWSEALNLGAYDVLAQPFDRDELERVVAAARRHFDTAPLRFRRSISIGAA